MSIVSLSLAKLHCKIDGNAEDELVSLYIRAAETWFGNYIGKPLSAFDPLPADLEVAVLDLVAFHYQMRGFVSFGVSVKIAPEQIIRVAESYRVSRFGVTVDEPEGATDGV